MNDTTIIILLGFVATIITIVTPIIKLNGSITKLNVTIDMLVKNMEKNDCDINDHDKRLAEDRRCLDNHEFRIKDLEKCK